MLVGYERLNKLITRANTKKYMVYDLEDTPTNENDNCCQIFTDYMNKRIDALGLLKRYKKLKDVRSIDTDSLIYCLAMLGEDYVNNQFRRSYK